MEHSSAYAPFTDAQLKFIYERKASRNKTAEMFGCHWLTIYRIRRGETYRAEYEAFHGHPPVFIPKKRIRDRSNRYTKVKKIERPNPYVNGREMLESDL